MNKPRVLYITLYLPIRNIHGGGNRMFEQIKFLSGKYNIHLISFIREWEEKGMEHLKLYCKRIDTVETGDGKSKSCSFVSPGFIKNYYSSEMDLLIRKRISEGDFDIIQFEYLPMARYADGLKIKAKSILVEHQLGFMCLNKEMRIESNIFKKTALLFRYFRLLRYEIKIFKKFDRIVFISGAESDRAGIGNLFVSPMGIDIGYFKPDKAYTEDIDLIFIGNFENFQNKDSMDYFIKYIQPLIKEKMPEVNTMIIGFNSKERLGFLKDIDGVEVMGKVEDTRSYLCRAKVFIMPARIGGGMRGKLLEAMAMGKPVVSTTIGAEGYDGSILKAMKIADDPAEFADNTLELLRNKAMREEMGSIGRSEAEKRYTWKHIFSEMDILYERLLSRE